jgi:hypothetical protein
MIEDPVLPPFPTDNLQPGAFLGPQDLFEFLLVIKDSFQVTVPQIDQIIAGITGKDIPGTQNAYYQKTNQSKHAVNSVGYSGRKREIRNIWPVTARSRPSNTLLRRTPAFVQRRS